MHPHESKFFRLGSLVGKVRTLDQLRKRGIPLANRCPLCKSEEENIDHLLLCYDLVQDLRALLFAIFGINWVLPSSVQEMMAGWRRPFGRKNAKKNWMASPIVLFWSIWRETNGAVFDEGVPSTQKMNSFVYALWSWTSVLS